MKLNLKNRHLGNLLLWIVSLNIFFLASTHLFHTYFYKVQDGDWESGNNIKHILVKLSLANENVLATWYSSMLLLFVGIVFFTCYLIQKKAFTKRIDKNMAYGWLIFSGIFALLSLDEMASLHERLGNINALNPLGNDAPGWVFLLAIPILLVGCFMAWFCLLQIKRAPLAALFAVVGILLFASIPVQEYFELKAWGAQDYSETWERPVIFLLLEEGSEIFGATFMMISGFLFNIKISTGRNYGPGSSLATNLQLNKRKTIAQAAAGLIFLALLMVALVNSNMLEHEGEITDLGKRENWFPAATAFLSSLLCFYLYLYPKNSFSKSTNIFLYLSIFCLFISAYYGGDFYSYLYNPQDSIFKLFIVAFLAFVSLGLAMKLFISVKDKFTRGAVLVWALLLVPAYFVFKWYAAALIFTGFSVLVIALLYNITSESSTTSTMPLTKSTGEGIIQ